jgi:hypothetical protein
MAVGLAGTSAATQALRHLSSCSRLAALNLLNCNDVDSRCMPLVAAIESLTSLLLSSTSLTLSPLAKLSALPRLRALHLPSPSSSLPHSHACSAFPDKIPGRRTSGSPVVGAVATMLAESGAVASQAIWAQLDARVKCAGSLRTVHSMSVRMHTVDAASVPLGAPLRTGHELGMNDAVHCGNVKSGAPSGQGPSGAKVALTGQWHGVPAEGDGFVGGDKIAASTAGRRSFRHKLRDAGDIDASLN